MTRSRILSVTHPRVRSAPICSFGRHRPMQYYYCLCSTQPPAALNGLSRSRPAGDERMQFGEGPRRVKGDGGGEGGGVGDGRRDNPRTNTPGTNKAATITPRTAALTNATAYITSGGSDP